MRPNRVFQDKKMNKKSEDAQSLINEINKQLWKLFQWYIFYGQNI